MTDDVRQDKKKRMRTILSGMLHDRGWEAQLELHSIFLHWGKVVDPEVGAHTQPLKIVRGTLWLEVENSAWLQQLQFQKVSVLRSVNSFLQGQEIRGIRLVLPQVSGPARPRDPLVRFQAPPPEEVQRFREQAACIEDEATREALIRFWYLARACVRDEPSPAVLLAKK